MPPTSPCEGTASRAQCVRCVLAYDVRARQCSSLPCFSRRQALVAVRVADAMFVVSALPLQCVARPPSLSQVRALASSSRNCPGSCTSRASSDARQDVHLVLVLVDMVSSPCVKGPLGTACSRAQLFEWNIHLLVSTMVRSLHPPPLCPDRAIDVYSCACTVEQVVAFTARAAAVVASHRSTGFEARRS